MTRTLLLSLSVVCSIGFAALSGCGSKDDAPPTNSINAETAKDRQAKVDNLHPVVQLRTTAGEILIQLDAEHAPVTVANFLAYVNRGHYDGTVFHEVEKGFIVLGGGYDANLQEKPADFVCRNEAHNGQKNVRGTVAMARRPDIIDSSTSMFFVNVADNPVLDYQGEEAEEYGYCVFGKVIDGMNVIDKIAATPTRAVDDQFPKVPTEQIAIKSVRRVR